MAERMNYYDVSFYYPGPRCNIVPDEVEANAAFAQAEKLVHEAINKIGDIEWRHAYGWPDGSLYFFARTLLDTDRLKSLVNAALPEKHWVDEIYVHTPDHDPHKYKVKTLEEYFGSSLKWEIGWNETQRHLQG